MIVAIIVIACAAGLYQLLAILAVLTHLRRKPSPQVNSLPVSILKPVYGKDAGFYDAIRTHAVQAYPEFEILFGIRREDDPARVEVKRLSAEFPALPIRLVLCTTSAPNLKVGSLIDLAREARHPIWIVNDSDISVPAGYIGDVTAPLSDPGIGMVTCLYRAEAHDWPSRLEALGIATDFAPSTLVAQLFGVSDFGLGSTLAFRRADLDRIGGFRGHRRLYRRRLPARPQTARSGPAQRNFRSGGEHAARIGIVARRLAASSALGENDSIVRRCRIRRLADYLRQPMGSDRRAFWTLVDRSAAARRAAGHGYGFRRTPARQRGRLEILLCHPAPRSMRRRGMGGGLGWRHGGVARSTAKARLRRKNRRAASMTCYNGLRAPVAQLDRASGYEPEGRMFESCRAHHGNQ